MKHKLSEHKTLIDTSGIQFDLHSLQQSGIRTDGLLMNADAGFDTEELWALCNEKDIVGNIDFNSRNGREGDDYFDELLNRKRYVMERTNDWMDAY